MVKSLLAMQEAWVQSLAQKIPWGREWPPTPVFLPGESHGQRSLAGCSPRGHKESLRATVPGSGRCPGGGHGNPLQYSCLESPRDRGAWRAAVHGVSKSRTRLSDEHYCNTLMLIYLQIIYGLFHKASAELNSFSKDHTVYET